MPFAWKLAFLVVLHAARVAADGGDDFSNDLFSDLAPLLALFGERVTMQFMSQSMGWADNIVLAMAPLGVITIIVSAIRVGGPSWLKALVGRARENLAAAEVELMSSTSNEVCELWNGRQVVRCMGSAPVVEFMCLLPAGWLEKVPRTQPNIKIIDFETAKGKYLAKIELNMRDDFNRWRAPRNPPERPHPNTDLEDEPDDPSEMIIVGKKIDGTAAAPNISLNSHSYFWRGELRAIAVVGTILQLGVLAYSGFATYHPKLKFKKDDGPVADYAYPCTAVGTLILVAGIFTCAHVVESSTAEERYHATKGKGARLVWLQQAKTVNDQAFDSFAIFAEGDRAVITTSRRAGIRDKTTALAGGTRLATQRETTDEAGGNPLLELKTVIGTLISLGGFIVQFSGLRGMHWSASVVQLGAVLVMTAFRAWVRRGLARPPRCQRISSRFELEWFATTLGDVASAPWVVASNSKEEKQSASGSKDGVIKGRTVVTGASPERHPKLGDMRKSRGFEAEGSDSKGKSPSAPDSKNGVTKGWTIVTGERPKTHPKLSKIRKSRGSEASKITDAGGHETIEAAEDKGPEATDNSSKAIDNGSEAIDDISEAHMVLMLRRDLGRLAHWRGPASAEAIALTAAIEIAMNTLFGTTELKELTWPVGVRYAGSDTQLVRLRLEKRGGTWRAAAGEIDAALSLWLYSVDGYEQNGSLQEQPKQGVNGRQRPMEEDEWLREEGPREKRSLRLLGPASRALHRDLSWWIPRGMARVMKVKEEVNVDEEEEEDEGEEELIEVQNHRIVGSEPRCRERPRKLNGRARYRGREFPTRFQHGSYEDLGSLSSIHLFHRGKVSATRGNLVDTWNGDEEVGKAVLATESHDALRLLYAQDMFTTFMWSMARTMAPIEDEPAIRLDDAYDVHGMRFFTLWDENLAKMAQDIQTAGLGGLDQIYLSIIPPLSVQQKLPRTEAIIDFVQRHARPYEQLQQWTEAGNAYLWLLRTAKSFPQDSSFATSAIAVFMEYLRLLSLNVELREAQRGRKDELRNLRSCLERELEPLGRWILSSLMKLYELRGRGWTCIPVQEARCGWVENTGWHETFKLTDLYGVSRPGLHPWDIMSADRSGVLAKDIHNFTPLHDAALDGTQSVVLVLLNMRADVNARDLNEWTPLHYACRRGALPIVQDLIRRGAEINARGRDGIAPLHNAAINGHLDVVRTLIESGATVDVLDMSRNTPLLWAAYNGHSDVFGELSEGANRKLRNDNGQTALHLAAMAGREEVVKLLSKLGGEAEARDSLRRTPLHHAARNGHQDVVRLLIADFDADIEVSDYSKATPLHLATENGHEATVRFLVECGADTEVVDARNSTLLHYAAKGGSKAIVELLVKLGVGTNAESVFEEGPLHIAASEGHVTIVKLLLGLGVDKDVRDFNGWTPLHYAAREGREVTVKALLELGADMEARDSWKRTPLHVSVKDGCMSEAVVRSLVEHGANVWVRDGHGMTPLDYANGSGEEDIAKLLRDSLTTTRPTTS